MESENRILQRIADAANLAMDAPGLTAGIVSAFVSNNPLPAKDLPGLVEAVHRALIGLADNLPSQTHADEPTPVSAAEIRKSITESALISFLDGKPYKTLKRHLSTHGHTPASYRAQFGLPSDYPMVSPNYSAQRSAMAKSFGLGRPAAPLKAVA